MGGRGGAEVCVWGGGEGGAERSGGKVLIGSGEEGEKSGGQERPLNEISTVPDEVPATFDQMYVSF